jgi:5-methylcytosine-specific restriction endonuclease McrA
MRLPGPFAAPPKRKAPNTCRVCDVPIDYRAKACNVHRHAIKRMQRERKCATCGKTFTPFPSAIRRSAAKFCSSACYFASVASRPAFIAVQCDNCRTTFRRTAAAVKRTKHSFCSSRCSAEYQSGERHHAYRGGEAHRRGPGWTANRDACRERDEVCRSCGKDAAENRQALSVDHLIPWRLFADEKVANDLDNLVALCRACHAKKTGRAEAAYVRGDVLEWLAFLRDVGVDPLSLTRFEPFLSRVERDAA